MNFRGKTFLIVDDEEGIREILRYELEFIGARVFDADNGISALRVLGENHVDVVLCDVHMPKMDGLEFLEAVAELPIRPRIFMITGYTDYSQDLLISRGATAVFQKPFHFDSLAKAIHDRLETSLDSPHAPDADAGTE